MKASNISAVRRANYPSPFGSLTIGWRDDCVVEIRHTSSCREHDPSPVSDLAAAQLQEYFAGKRKTFSFPLAPAGTPFPQAVWAALGEIPWGETRSYGQIAAAIGKPQAARAVGMACNRNPIWIAIPCHRVIGAGKQLTGYAGGLSMKQALLELERT